MVKPSSCYDFLKNSPLWASSANLQTKTVNGISLISSNFFQGFGNTTLWWGFILENKLSKAVLVGIAGSNNAFSLSIYNLKAFAYNDPEIRDQWDISIIQHPLINVNRKDIEILPLTDRIVNAKPDLIGFSCYMWNVNVFDEIAQVLRKRIPKAKIIKCKHGAIKAH